MGPFPASPPPDPAVEPIPVVAEAGPPAPRRRIGAVRHGVWALDFGQVVVPFGHDPARTRVLANLARQRRMTDVERDLVRQRVALAGAAPGVSARVAGRGPLVFDAAVLAPSLRGEPQLAVPDLAARAGIGPRGRRRDGVTAGLSGWTGAGGADVAVAVDAGVRTGPWDLRVGADWQRTTRAKEAFGEAVSGRRVWGDTVSLDVRRTLVRGFTLDGESEGCVFVSRRGTLATPPWVRSAVALTADPRGPVRWTLVELATIERIGTSTAPGPDVVRVSTRFDAARWR